MLEEGKTFGALLRQHRVQRGLMQGDLAERAGYTGNSRHAIVSKVETAAPGKFADAAQVAKLVQALHEERHFTLTEIHQLATTYLGLDTLSETGERSHLAVAIPGIAYSAFWSAVTASVAMRATQGFSLILRTHGEDFAVEQEILESFLERAHSLAAVVLAPAQGLYKNASSRQSDMRRRLISELQERDVPVILVDRSLPGSDQAALRARAPVVRLDHYDAARKAIRKLCEAGHCRIGILLDTEHDTTQQQRCRGAVDEMRLRGLDVDKRLIAFGTPGPQVDSSALISSPLGFHSIRANAVRILSQQGGADLPTALFCTTEYAALEAYAAIVDDYHLRIPEQISLLGFDDVPALGRLAISHVPYSPYELAAFAMSKVRDYIDPAFRHQAHHDNIWQVGYTAPEWNISVTGGNGTVQDIHDAADRPRF